MSRYGCGEGAFCARCVVVGSFLDLRVRFEHGDRSSVAKLGWRDLWFSMYSGEVLSTAVGMTERARS